jgi:hypothetical protein
MQVIFVSALEDPSVIKHNFVYELPVVFDVLFVISDVEKFTVPTKNELIVASVIESLG